MIEAASLRECPFCDSSHVDLCLGNRIGSWDNGFRFVQCLNCGASTSYRTKNEAIACWNNRVSEEKKSVRKIGYDAIVEANRRANAELSAMLTRDSEPGFFDYHANVVSWPANLAANCIAANLSDWLVAVHLPRGQARPFLWRRLKGT